MKKALICGVSGQDGTYLTELLLSKGYHVYGGSRDAQGSKFEHLRAMGIASEVELVSINVADFRSVLQTIIKTEPDEVYNLAGQSSVGLSFEQPVETLESVVVGTLNILEAIRFSGLDIKFYNAGSSECFGDTKGIPATEGSPFDPQSPYAIAKSSAFWLVDNYRKSYGLKACTGILFNHESPLRPRRFVTRKIIAAACDIKKGKSEKLSLGNIDIVRDWGWAPEYVEAMWRMLQQESLEDFVIATGESNSLREFIKIAFEKVGLDYNNYLEIDPKFIRPTDLMVGLASPERARKKLGWSAKTKMSGVVEKMIEAEESCS